MGLADANIIKGFPNSSVGKESACNAGDLGLIPGSGRSTGEGIGYPLQYSWASPVAQLVRNLPAMQETLVQYLGWDNPLKKGKATHSNILAWRILWSCKQSDTPERLSLSLLFGRKAMTNLDSILKSRDITLPTKVHVYLWQIILVFGKTNTIM